MSELRFSGRFIVMRETIGAGSSTRMMSFSIVHFPSSERHVNGPHATTTPPRRARLRVAQPEEGYAVRGPKEGVHGE
jgi:hypothetical protein